MGVPSRCTIVKTMRGTAYALGGLSGWNKTQNPKERREKNAFYVRNIIRRAQPLILSKHNRPPPSYLQVFGIVFDSSYPKRMIDDDEDEVLKLAKIHQFTRHWNNYCPGAVWFCVGDHETPPQYKEGSIFDFLHYREVSSGATSLIEM
jgi:hypothetical protein